MRIHPSAGNEDDGIEDALVRADEDAEVVVRVRGAREGPRGRVAGDEVVRHPGEVLSVHRGRADVDVLHAVELRTRVVSGPSVGRVSRPVCPRFVPRRGKLDRWRRLQRRSRSRHRRRLCNQAQARHEAEVLNELGLHVRVSTTVEL